MLAGHFRILPPMPSAFSANSHCQMMPGSRFASFEEFVKGQAEKDAKAAEKALEDAMVAIGDIATDQAIKTQCDAAGVTYEGDMPPWSLPWKPSGNAKPGCLMSNRKVTCLILRIARLGYRKPSRRRPNMPMLRRSARKTRRPIRGRNFRANCTNSKRGSGSLNKRDAVKAEIERLQAVERLNHAKRLTDTRGLSRKKGELAEALITEAFVQRFRDELVALGASRIKVELVKKRVDRGHVLHELRLANARSAHHAMS